jgi:hypothetical protein
MVEDERDEDCPHFGEHVHSSQLFDSGWIRRRDTSCGASNFYKCEPSPGDFNGLDYGHWHRYVNWTW